MSKPTAGERAINALRRIAAYDSPAKMRRTSEKAWGLDYHEALEMAYENIQCEAKDALRGIRKPRKLASSDLSPSKEPTT